METLAHFDFDGKRGFYRPCGEMTLDDAGRLVTDGLIHARDRGIHQLLVDTTKMFGFASPTVVERFYLVIGWAVAAAGAVCVGMVARPEMIDHEKFGVIVARNRGLYADIFPTEAEAIAWLDSLRSPRTA